MADVSLSWTDNASSEDGFRVYRSTASSPTFNKGNADYTQIKQIATPDTTSYTDTNPPADETVFYAVTAYAANGESGATTDSVDTPLPITIDGTDVTEITIDGTTLTGLSIDGTDIF